ncbi:C4-dicarboxylate ABC transporter substrate-binding protein [Desulfosarcina ovata subsp. sediminis]|uniref:C4-dicarboxylate ABC transporter substrate-binding protein n=2 Tax=Desulfosarcina ovata TaxID=83564 RepID=A0A5K7ZPP9_9BACT|nr:C4-dicarboxylate ABC transporter substrate-binding protein [Desulfosarcina ovata subsp. sediminis]
MDRKTLAVFFALVLWLGMVVPTYAGSHKKSYLLRFAHGLPTTHDVAENFQFFKSLVETSSDHRLKVRLFPSGQLVNDKGLLQAVRTGAVDAGAVYAFYVEPIVPAFGLFTTPLVYDGTEQTIDAIEGRVGDLFFEALRKKGYVPLGWVVWPLETTGIESNAPVHVPLDLKGKVIRPLSPETVLYLQTYGQAQAAFVSGAELYTAIQRGTIDGSISSFDHAVTRKLSEVSPYFCVLPGVNVAHDIIFINRRVYRRLPPDLQQVLVEAARQTQRHSYAVGRKVVADMTIQANRVLKEVYYPTADDLALWHADLDRFFKAALKDNPEALALVMSERERMGKSK